MSMAEKVFEEIRTLPEFELREVLDFVGFLKTRHGIPAAQAANEATGMDAEEVNWVELEKLGHDLIVAPTKDPDLALMNEVRSKVRTGVSWTRNELYDRGLR